MYVQCKIRVEEETNADQKMCSRDSVLQLIILSFSLSTAPAHKYSVCLTLHIIIDIEILNLLRTVELTPHLYYVDHEIQSEKLGIEWTADPGQRWQDSQTLNFPQECAVEKSFC